MGVFYIVCGGGLNPWRGFPVLGSPQHRGGGSHADGVLWASQVHTITHDPPPTTTAVPGIFLATDLPPPPFPLCPPPQGEARTPPAMPDPRSCPRSPAWSWPGP